MEVRLFNLGTVNKNEVTLSKEFTETKNGNDVSLILTFSYRTCVGVELRGAGEYIKAVHQNDWSTTTGKLLNELESDKKKRVSAEEFKKILSKALIAFEQA